MIIECIKCSKRFNVNSDLIPSTGRTIQCGSCNHIWYYEKIDENLTKLDEIKDSKKVDISSQNHKKNLSKPSKKASKVYNENKPQINKPKGSEIVEYTPKSNFTFGKFLSYIVVLIISFISLIIVLDTFKTPLYDLFPHLELLLFSLYETLKDVELFIRDLI